MVYYVHILQTYKLVMLKPQRVVGQICTDILMTKLETKV